jgi:hypothetical protein
MVIVFISLITKMAGNIFIDGLPMEDKRKLIAFTVFSSLFMINQFILTIHPIFDYQYRSYLSIFFIIIAVIFSIGNMFAEGLVLGVSGIVFLLTLSDLSVIETSLFRKQAFILSIFLIIISFTSGRVSVLRITNAMWREAE